MACPDPPPPGVLELEEALVSSVRLRAEPERLAYEASIDYGYPAGFLARYFEKLRYSFGPRERAGLITFFELARDVGELEWVLELRFVLPEAARVKSNGNGRISEILGRTLAGEALGTATRSSSSAVAISFASAGPPTSFATARSTPGG